MKRLFVLLLVCIMAFSASGAGADAAPGEEDKYRDVDSYDFDLRFHMDADAFPFRQRKLMQGYAELLENLELKGNYSWCEESLCADLNFQLIPVSDPEAALVFRVFGRRTNWLNVSSPLMGEKAVCFQPMDIMFFTSRAWDFFQIPLFPLTIAMPGVLPGVYRELSHEWIKETEGLETGTANELTADTIGRITEGLREQLENDQKVTAMTTAIVKTLPGGEMVKDEISALPDLLMHSADGEGLTVESDGETLRYVNHRGETLYRAYNGGNVTESALTLPPSGTDYTPAYTFRREDGEKDYSLQLEASWDRTSGNETLPETIFRLKAELEQVPFGFPEKAEFSGEISVEGILLPNFHLLVNGITDPDGKLVLSLKLPDKPDSEPVFTCTGTVVPVAYEKGQLVYQMGEIVTDYNLFALNDQSLNELLDTMVPAMTEHIPDFIYAMPTHGVQSVLDTLEQYGLLQTTLN